MATTEMRRDGTYRYVNTSRRRDGWWSEEAAAKPVVATEKRAETSGPEAVVVVGGLAVGYVAYSGLMLVGATAMIAFLPLSLVFLGCAAMGGGKRKQRYYGKFEV
jgi:hypothetical protein